MRWTVKYFKHHSVKWMKFNSEAITKGDDGAAAYAARKQAMWLNMANSAHTQFQGVNPQYTLAVD